MTKTDHYEPNQWDAADPIRREDFNADNAAIDMALHSVRSEAAAERSALSKTVTALEANLGATGKNARIAWGTYTGTGSYGSDAPNSLTFDFIPVLIFILSDDETILGNSRLFRPCTYGTDGTNQNMRVVWTNHGVSWYTDTEFNPHIHQCNTAGYQYTYIAIGYEE